MYIATDTVMGKRQFIEPRDVARARVRGRRGGFAVVDAVHQPADPIGGFAAGVELSDAVTLARNVIASSIGLRDLRPPLPTHPLPARPPLPRLARNTHLALLSRRHPPSPQGNPAQVVTDTPRINLALPSAAVESRGGHRRLCQGTDEIVETGSVDRHARAAHHLLPD
jgi:hypothetical protein